MNINRNNYEEFFLLYIDNELSEQDRKAVEAFVAVHIDLGRELEMLQETVLPAPDFEYTDKELLMKPDPVMQQQLLLLLDNELGHDDKAAIESRIGQDTAVAAEWQLLQKTRLQPEADIKFENKALLYRKAPATVINMRWVRVAAAAMLIGFGTWGTLSYFNNNKTVRPGNTAANNTGSNNAGNSDKNTKRLPAIKQDNVAQTAAITKPVVPNEEKTVSTTSQAVGNRQKTIIAVPVTNVVKNSLPNQDQNNSNTVVKTNTNKPEDKQGNNLPVPSQNINREESNKTLFATVTPLNRDTRVNPQENPVKLKGNDNDQANNGAITAAYKPGDNTVTTTEDDDESTGKKSKLRGLFRKVKRVIDRTTNANSNSNSIKVAGFSFAIK